MNRKDFREKLKSASVTLLSDYVDECIDRVLSVKSEDLDNDTRIKVILSQECSELIKELTDDIRGKGDLTGILEEMADVMLGIFMLQKIYKISDELLTQAMNVKLDEMNRKISVSNKII